MKKKESLKEIFARIGHFGNDIGCNDKGGTHSYDESYDLLFDRFRDGCTLFEIGLAKGDSIRLWNEYFSNSTIKGCDLSIIFEPIKPMNGNTIDVFAQDATKPEIIKRLALERFDIIIDDGSHMEDDQVKTFEMLKHYMKPGGLYIIEDILALDHNRKRFESLHHSCEIIDLRKNKGRFDDVLIVYRF